MNIYTIYLSKKEPDIIERIERLANAKGITINKTINYILKDWLDNNLRYVDRKITDFETKSVLEVKKETELLFCDECGASLRDKDMWLIHHPDCGWTE